MTDAKQIEKRNYIVTATRQYNAWDDRPVTFEVRARTSAKAISKARKEASRECMFSSQDGKIAYRAKLQTAVEADKAAVRFTFTK